MVAIKTKQVEVFTVGDKEFKTFEEAEAYEKSLQIDFSSVEELEQAIEAKLVEVNFDQYKEYCLEDLQDEAQYFQEEYFSHITLNGGNPYDRVQIYVFDKYLIDSIRGNFYEFDHLSDEKVLKLYRIAFDQGHGNGFNEVENYLQDIADIVEIINKED